jgi:ABC-type amino acid transport substrate-binding protein
VRRRHFLQSAAAAFLGLWIGAGLSTALSVGAQPKQVLRIASDATFPPFHYVDGSAATGFDIELARLIAERAGFQPVVLVRPYDDLLAGLTSGAHDLVAATTGVTPEREKLYLFTRPYFETCQAALVRVGPREPATITDLRGRRVGAAGSGTSTRALRGIAGVEQVSLGKGQAGVPALEKGDIDALVVDEYGATAAARASKGRLRVLAEPLALERYAFVLPPGRDELKRVLDRALGKLEGEGRVRALQLRFGVERGEGWPVQSSGVVPKAARR